MAVVRLVLVALSLGALSMRLAAERHGVEASVSPRSGLAPLRVLLMVFSDEPDLTCPSIRVEWSEGNTSFQDSDCDPANVPETFTYSRRSPGGYGPGQHEIRVVLEQGRRRVVRSADFWVAGGE
jgi:hypothetical protein